MSATSGPLSLESTIGDVSAVKVFSEAAPGHFIDDAGTRTPGREELPACHCINSTDIMTYAIKRQATEIHIGVNEFIEDAFVEEALTSQLVT